jgi:tyrosyl-tRNA synthetase
MSKEGWRNARSANIIAFASGLFPSKSELRRKIDQGGVRINDQKLSSPSQLFYYRDVDKETGCFKVQFGKKVVLVRPV